MNKIVLVSASVALAVALLTVSMAHFLLLRPASQIEQPVAAVDRTEIGQIVRDYLLENPRLLEEVIAALEEEQAEAQLSEQRGAIIDNQEAIFESENGFVAGNPEGDVTLVEFFDYNCPYCRQMTPVILGMIEADPDLRVVFRDWPVLGSESVEAARVALAVKAEAPERFLDFHKTIMSQSGRLDGERALAVAQEMGLDRQALEAASARPEVEDALRETHRLGNLLGLRGTPSYVLGDEVLAGAVGEANLRERIAYIRENGCAVC